MYSDVSKKVMMLIREISLHFTRRGHMYTYMSRRMNGEGRKTEMIEIEVHEKLNRFNFRPTFPIFGQLCQFRDISTFYNSGLKSERERERELIRPLCYNDPLLFFIRDTYSILSHFINIDERWIINYRISEKFVFKLKIYLNEKMNKLYKNIEFGLRCIVIKYTWEKNLWIRCLFEDDDCL